VALAVLMPLTLTVACAHRSQAEAGGEVTRHLDSISDAIRNCAQSFAEADQFSGVVLLERGGKRVLAAAYGLADPATGRTNTIDTPFNIASVGKIFTATAAGQLIDEGKLRLDDPVGRYLPELQPPLASITIGQLLNHSSGVGEIVTPTNQQRIAGAKTARELLKLIADQPLASDPGTRRRYSNTGPILLGAVIEAISGQSYSRYVQEHIFTPAGMSSSTVRGRPVNAAEMLTRSEVLTGEMRITSGQKLPRRPASFAGGGPFGGGYSSAPDLVRFATAMRAGRLLSDRAKALLWSNATTVPGAGPGRYAYGFQVSDEGGVMTVGHSGLGGGANAEFHWSPEDGWTLVVLSNYDPMAATIIANAARLALTGLESPAEACEAAKRGRGMPGPMGPGPGPGPSPGPGRSPGPGPEPRPSPVERGSASPAVPSSEASG
jgi:D-alanyl-D-alanine carboxypeptidase